MHLTGTDEGDGGGAFLTANEARVACGAADAHAPPSPLCTAPPPARHGLPLFLIYSCINRIWEQFLPDDFSRDGTNGTAGVMAAINSFFLVLLSESFLVPLGRVSRRQQGGGCRAARGRSSRAGLESFGGGDGRARKWLGSRASLPAT